MPPSAWTTEVGSGVTSGACAERGGRLGHHSPELLVVSDEQKLLSVSAIINRTAQRFQPAVRARAGDSMSLKQAAPKICCEHEHERTGTAALAGGDAERARKAPWSAYARHANLLL